MAHSERVFEIIRSARLPLCITDPNQDDNPIVFANAAFSELTGYPGEEVLGKNCRFLQGPDTSEKSIARVRKILRQREVATVEIVNYRKDGSKFINALQLGPIFDEGGDLQYFFGSQLDVTKEREREEQARQLADDEVFHRLRNVVNVMSVIVRMTAAQHTDVSSFGRRLIDRLTALSEAHFSTANRSRHATSIKDIVLGILKAYAPIGEEQFDVSGPAVMMSSSMVSVASLVLHELATNAVKHGALGADAGRVEISWQKPRTGEQDWLALDWTEHGGTEPASESEIGGTGIIQKLVLAAGGTLDFDWDEAGLKAKLRLPLDPVAETLEGEHASADGS